MSRRGVGGPAVGPAVGVRRWAGGTTNLVFDPDAGAMIESYARLSGTIRNGAGGPTPEGTWLSCEQTTLVSSPPEPGVTFAITGPWRKGAL